MNKKLLYISLLMNIAIASGYALHHQFNSTMQAQLQGSQKKLIRVYVDMIGDLFHAGHVSFLKKAREVAAEQGSEVQLIVGMVSDDIATGYKRKPILSLENRTAAARGCKYVNEIIPDCPLVLDKKFIEEHQIDIVVHGDDYTEEQKNEYYGVPVRMGIYRTVPYTTGISTTEIIRRIKERPDLGTTHPFKQMRAA